MQPYSNTSLLEERNSFHKGQSSVLSYRQDNSIVNTIIIVGFLAQLNPDFVRLLKYFILSKLTIVSREAKKKQAIRNERVSYLHVAPL